MAQEGQQLNVPGGYALCELPAGSLSRRVCMPVTESVLTMAGGKIVYDAKVAGAF